MSDVNKIPSRGTLLDMDECVKKVGNRFNLVLIASLRARELNNSHREQQKHLSPAVSALLDVQDGKVDSSYLKKIK